MDLFTVKTLGFTSLGLLFLVIVLGFCLSRYAEKHADLAKRLQKAELVIDGKNEELVRARDAFKGLRDILGQCEAAVVTAGQECEGRIALLEDTYKNAQPLSAAQQKKGVDDATRKRVADRLNQSLP